MPTSPYVKPIPPREHFLRTLRQEASNLDRPEAAELLAEALVPSGEQSLAFAHDVSVAEHLLELDPTDPQRWFALAELTELAEEPAFDARSLEAWAQVHTLCAHRTDLESIQLRDDAIIRQAEILHMANRGLEAERLYQRFSRQRGAKLAREARQRVELAWKLEDLALESEEGARTALGLLERHISQRSSLRVVLSFGLSALHQLLSQNQLAAIPPWIARLEPVLSLACPLTRRRLLAIEVETQLQLGQPQKALEILQKKLPHLEPPDTLDACQQQIRLLALQLRGLLSLDGHARAEPSPTGPEQTLEPVPPAVQTVLDGILGLLRPRPATHQAALCHLLRVELLDSNALSPRLLPWLLRLLHLTEDLPTLTTARAWLQLTLAGFAFLHAHFGLAQQLLHDAAPALSLEPIRTDLRQGRLDILPRPWDYDGALMTQVADLYSQFSVFRREAPSEGTALLELMMLMANTEVVLEGPSPELCSTFLMVTDAVLRSQPSSPAVMALLEAGLASQYHLLAVLLEVDQAKDKGQPTHVSADEREGARAEDGWEDQDEEAEGDDDGDVALEGELLRADSTATTRTKAEAAFSWPTALKTGGGQGTPPRAEAAPGPVDFVDLRGRYRLETWVQAALPLFRRVVEDSAGFSGGGLQSE